MDGSPGQTASFRGLCVVSPLYGTPPPRVVQRAPPVRVPVSLLERWTFFIRFFNPPEWDIRYGQVSTELVNSFHPIWFCLLREKTLTSAQT